MGTTFIVRPAELAALLRCKKSTLIAWERAGIIPPAKRNGSRFVFWSVQQIAEHIGKDVEILAAELKEINEARLAARQAKKGKNDMAAEVTR